jgi:hypothetical protein
MLTVGQQAVIDSYLCLVHLTAGMLSGTHRFYL